MKNQKLPPSDHVVRYVPFGKLRKDENDIPIGILGAAFKLRDGEQYLSITWLEYFAGSKNQQSTAAVQAVRARLCSACASKAAAKYVKEGVSPKFKALVDKALDGDQHAIELLNNAE